MTSVFNARGVSVSFGGVRAVAGVDLEIEEGELVGLIGPNGAGKTTFIDAVTGFVRYQGTVELGGTRLDRLPPHARAQRGLARTWQTVELFDDLSVRENLTVAAKGGASVDDELELLDLADVADSMPWELAQAARKRAGIGRALVARPRLLCLDEPGAGLDVRQSRELGALLAGIADSGTAVLLVDHDMGLVLSACDRIVVLESGAVIAQGTADEIRGDERVISAYLGHSTTDTTDKTDTTDATDTTDTTGAAQGVGRAGAA
jgi:branched-chain amino acid transport system ATP-binding protein